MEPTKNIKEIEQELIDDFAMFET
ncbi:MAG: hypothetical protein RLZZ520_892, partial [Bacteroidota bacterium]